MIKYDHLVIRVVFAMALQLQINNGDPSRPAATVSDRAYASRGGTQPTISVGRWLALAVLRVIPWGLFFLVAFQLVPAGWEFEGWPRNVQTGTIVVFGLFVLIDTTFTAWNVAFRPTRREAK